MKNESVFVKKIKNRNFQTVAGCSKKDLNELTKPIQNLNIVYQQIKNDCEIVITTIERKQGKATIDYIRKYNANKKYAKTI